MDLSYSDEQIMLRDSAERFVEANSGAENLRKMRNSDEGFSRDNWKQMAELGWLALPFTEAQGGLDGTAVDTNVLMEAFGKGLVLEPFLTTVVMGGGALKAAGNDAQIEALVPQIIEGNLLLAVAYAEPQARFDLFDVATTARKDGSGWVIDGHKAVVLHGDSADKIIVSARTSGDRRDKDGISLFIIDRGAAGLERRAYPTVDGSRAAELIFNSVKVGADALLGAEGQGLAVLEKVSDDAITALCAEAVGAMKVLLDTTVEYTKTREQFGQPISKFQVLRHRMADMMMEYEQAKSMALVAALKVDSADPVERRKAVSGAKVQIGKSGRFVGQQAVQLHGGMGMTDELSVGHYFKRLTMIDILFGNVDHHLKQFSAAA
ncbi:acyl-CoA dehydrogenase family protein [Iodidimonas sp. SYSU 1G8]|uniref:acyl-CoA dehydrogenase family protein n=1 Tax=Iodidimonas sp. SYSU 1G8 TaxID=3133967 RepID=UPI0031FE6B51